MKMLKIGFLATMSMLYSSSIFAGSPGSITVTPIANNAVPTLSGTMLIVLSLLLFAVALRMGVNKKHSGTPMALIGAIGISGLIAASGGIKIVSDAYADGTGAYETLIPIDPFNAQSDTKFLIPNLLNVVENRSTLNQRITNILYDGGCYDSGNRGPIQGTPECKVGNVIPIDVQGLCYIDCRTGPIQE